MNSKEIEELREKVYEMSNSMLPLNTFFNDIRDNPNENYDKELAYNDLSIIVDYIIYIRNRLEKLEEELKNANKFIFNAGQQQAKSDSIIELVKLLNISVLEEKEDDELCYQIYCNGNKAYITKEEYELLKEVFEDGK